MRVKLHELKQGSSLEEYLNDLDNLAHHLQLPEQDKIHYFIFGLKDYLCYKSIFYQKLALDV